MATGEFLVTGDDRLKAQATSDLSSSGAEMRGVATQDTLESVILVDARNNVTGSCEKLVAHREGKLHRAFSILITNLHGELLLQRRAACKYHFANRWSNTCCGHPRPGENTLAAACRRLMEELGISVPLTQVTEFSYVTTDPVSGLVENEYLHVFQGLYTGEPFANPAEVSACRWMRPERIRRGLVAHPDWFTPWFRLLPVTGQPADMWLIKG